MPQHDQVIDNSTGLAVRTDINAALSALFSSSSGTVEPVVKDPGQLWFDTSTPTVMRLALRDQANATWLNVAVDSGGAFNTMVAGDSIEATGPNAFTKVTGGAVHRAGDTMTGGLKITKPYAVAGDQALNVAPTAGSANITLNKPAGSANITNVITGQTAGIVRWQIQAGTATAESGANAGSDFNITRFTDAGALIDAPFTIGRAAGTVNFTKTVLSDGYLGRRGQGGITGQVNNFYWNNTAMECWIGSTNAGSFAFASDYRIKKDVAPLASSWERVKALKPIRYSLQDYTPPGTPLKEDGTPPDPLVVNDDTERWGFIAHELQETLIMDAATGVKDSPEHVQSPNPWTLIAVLTKALQEAMGRIEVLEAAAGG
jgi:hypothetical protein